MRSALSSRNLALGAVAVLLFLVSVPRVHELALQDNQRDAQSAVRVLAEAAFPASATEKLSPYELSVALSERLRDVRFHKDSGLIQRHGYLFEVSSDTKGSDLIRAWPVDHGETGVMAYMMDNDSPLRTHRNSNATWSGVSMARPTGEETGWFAAPSAR
jgi:hypothetical protein